MLSSQARVLGEFLVERHVLSRDDLAIAMAESRRTGEALPGVLRAEGLVSEKDLTAAIAETVGVRFVDFTVIWVCSARAAAISSGPYTSVRPSIQTSLVDERSRVTPAGACPCHAGPASLNVPPSPM